MTRESPASPISTANIVLIVLLLCPLTAAGYESDIHFSLTMWLSELVGFGESAAFELAKFDQATDDDPRTQPLWDLTSTGYDRRRQWHFPTPQRLQELETRALGCTRDRISAVQYKQAGQFLHVLQDSFAHREYDALAGHLLSGHTPDKPWSNPVAFLDMVQRVLGTLSDIRARCTSSASRISDGERRRIRQELENWARDEVAAGIGDVGAPVRWGALARALYGDRFREYTGRHMRSYEAWRVEQSGQGWRAP